MAEDLRNATAEEYWDRLKAMMGADGLMTYWYLGRTVNAGDLPGHDTMRLRRDMRNAAGGLMAAPLAIAAPETGGFTDMATVPAPVTYGLHVIDDGRDVSQISMRHETVRPGRRMGFGRTEIVDAANPTRVIAIATGSGIKLADAPPGFRPIDLPPDIEDSPDLPPLPEVFGATRRAHGVWALPELNPKMASTSASLHLGPVHIVLEAAAIEVASAAADVDTVQVEDWDVQFVAPGTVGPFRATGHAAAGNLDRVACRMALQDEGNGDRIVASALAVFRPARAG
jgi:hypothetical protein